MDKKLLIKYSFAIVAVTCTVIGVFRDLGKISNMFTELVAVKGEDNKGEW